MHKRSLRIRDGISDRQELLRDIHVATAFFKHCDDAPKMAFGAS
jgi:hypothetical protein